MKQNECVEKLELAEQEYANSSKGIRELSKKYQLERQIFTGWLLAKGYTIENKRASKMFNIHYFDSIDTEEKAYWLGFLFADGSIGKYKTSYRIELSLKIDDKEHVKKFANAINKEYVNNDSTYRSRCNIGNKHMFEILESYGCTRRKSLTLKFPDISIFKDYSLIRHFIRGYVEGDGCLSYCDKDHTKPTVSILGTTDFLSEIQQQYGSQQSLNQKAGKNPITKVLTYNGKSGYLFAKWLYDSATIYLDRKYLRYKEYCRLYEESYKLQQGKIGEGCDANTEQTIDISQGFMAV